MNKVDLIVALAVKEKLTEKQATDIIKFIFNGFIYTLKKGDRIETPLRMDGSLLECNY